MKTITASFTRPNDTTQYAAGEVITAATAAVMEFTKVGRDAQRGAGVIVDAILVDSAAQTTKLSAELWLFTSAMTMDNDNAVFTPTDTELLDLVGVIQFTTAFVGDATAGANGNCVLQAERTYLPINYQCKIGVTSLYGVLVTRNAYTPVAQESFAVLLKIIQE